MGEIDGFGSTKVMIVDAAGNAVTTGNPLPAGFTGTFSGASGAVTAADGAIIVEGAVADAAVTGDTGGSLSAKLRGLNKTTGAAADANTANTVMGRLTKIRDLIVAKLAVTIADGDDVSLGAIGDAAVAVNATGTVHAKLRRATQGLEDLKTLIVLAAGANKIGGVTVADGDDAAEGAKADVAWVSGSGSVIALLKAVVGKLTLNPLFYYQTHDYTGNTGGFTAVDMTAYPAKDYSIQVSGETVGNASQTATSWTVTLEGSLDNLNWTTIATQNTGATDGAVVSAVGKPMRYMRMNCSALSLGSAHHITVSIVAKT